jgi:hypothetical protein
MLYILELVWRVAGVPSRERSRQESHIAASRATARRNPEPILVDQSPSPGFQFWKVGDVLVGMPKLLPNAPASVRRHYRARSVANATGECPRCDSITTDPLQGHAVSLSHNDRCPLLLNDIERWIDPRSQPLRDALNSGWSRGAA